MSYNTSGPVSGGGGGAEPLIAATGFSSGNVLDSAAGVLNGAANMTIMSLVRLAQVQDGGGLQVLLSNGTLFLSGYELSQSELRPFVSVGDGSGSKVGTGSFPPDWSPGVAGTPPSFGFIDWKTAILGLRYDATGALSIWCNMIKIREVGATAGYTPGVNGMKVGRQVDESAFFQGAVAGIAYADAAFTEAQIRTWMRACMEAVDVVPGVLPWDNLWSFKQMGLAGGAAVPGVVNDQIGSADLTLTGALTVVSEIPRWL